MLPLRINNLLQDYLIFFLFVLFNSCRHGLDTHGGFFIPANAQQTVLAERVACLQRVQAGARRLLDSLFVSSSDSTADFLGAAPSWIKEAESKTTVLLSLAVEFSVVSPKEANQTGWKALPCPAIMTATPAVVDLPAEQANLLTEPGTYRLHYCPSDESFPRWFDTVTVNGPGGRREELRERKIGMAHHSNWGMLRYNSGGAGGLSARNIILPEDGSLDDEFDIGGGLAPLVDDVLAAVAAVDPATGPGAVEAAAQAAFSGSSSSRTTRSTVADGRTTRNTQYVGTLRSLVHPIGNNPNGFALYEAGRRRELGSGGELLSARVLKDLTGFTNGIASTSDERKVGAEVVLSGVVRRVTQVIGVGARGCPSLRAELTVELSPTSGDTESTLLDRLMELVKETYARLLLLEPSRFTKVRYVGLNSYGFLPAGANIFFCQGCFYIYLLLYCAFIKLSSFLFCSPTSAIAFLWTRMAVEIKDYLCSMLKKEVDASGTVHPLWASLAAGFLGNLNLSISSWSHGHELTKVCQAMLSVFLHFVVVPVVSLVLMYFSSFLSAGYQAFKRCFSSCSRVQLYELYPVPSLWTIHGEIQQCPRWGS